jgi:NADH-quinone oxidoreductase subunit L
MAGPTPVSALLHSATMVAAGVYLIVRSLELLAGWPLQAVGWIGAVTAVAAAAIALAQRDLKRVLAGSTASQLGLMFVGAAAGGPAVAVFQLIAHAAGKAGMFLATGVLQHQRGSVELDRLRGSGRDDRAAFAGFAICALSIAAVPPLAAFWSKDHIAAAAQSHTAWFVLTLISAAGSAAYLLRPALILWDRRGAGRAQRPPGRRVMVGAVAVLAVASLVGGLLGDPLVELLGTAPLPTSALSLALGLLAVAAGAVAAVAHVHVPHALAAAARQQLYTGDLQRWAAQQPVLLASRLLDGVETRVLQPATDAVGRLGLVAARASDRLERHAIDATTDRIAAAVLSGGDDTRRLQSGRLYEYLRDAVLGAVAIGVLIALAAVL